MMLRKVKDVAETKDLVCKILKQSAVPRSVKSLLRLQLALSRGHQKITTIGRQMAWM